jgi:hypothetical protein
MNIKNEETKYVKSLSKKSMRRWKNDIKMDLKGIGYEGVVWIHIIIT